MAARGPQSATLQEIALGVGESGSWHARYRHSAYVFAGGLPFELTEGDLLAVFAQFGEVVDVALVRDAETGRSRGFAFVAYEDQRSTNLAVDNLGGARLLGRMLRVEHVDDYTLRRKEAEAAGGALLQAPPERGEGEEEAEGAAPPPPPPPAAPAGGDAALLAAVKARRAAADAAAAAAAAATAAAAGQGPGGGGGAPWQRRP